MPRGNGITRHEILSCIKINGAMTADELSQQLGISQVAVRQHLSALEAEGIISVSVERRGLGRPSHRYTLTALGDETFPRRYDAFAHDILEELRMWQGDDAVLDLLDRRRNRLRNLMAPRLQDKPLGARLNEIARAETEQGFMTETCAEEAGTFLLVRRNCAVCAVARVVPEICCKKDAGLLSDLLGDVEVSLAGTIQDGDHACTFRIRPKTSG